MSPLICVWRGVENLTGRPLWTSKVYSSDLQIVHQDLDEDWCHMLGCQDTEGPGAIKQFKHKTMTMGLTSPKSNAEKIKTWFSAFNAFGVYISTW
jgi:hypothetical protein